MGKIISNLSYRNDYKKCELNFEEAKPSDDAKAIFDLLKEMFEKSGRLKQELENYQDCTKEVREAMENPDDPEVVSRCFAVINERVAVGKRLYDFSLLAQNALDRFIEIFEPILSSTDALKPLLVNEQALVYQVIHLLASILKVDEAKLKKPALQNDLAFYRRVLPKVGIETELCISRNDVNNIISFLAEHIPLTRSISNNLAETAKDKTAVAELLAEMANGSFKIVHAKKFPPESPENIVFLQAMVLTIIVYDSLRPDGAFTSGSSINLRFILRFLQNSPISDFKEAKALCNHVRYGCNPDNYRKAPESIHSMFDF
ncbi:Protein fam49b [Bonamia ostreae]|uniref:Protein fam49b n=1 Tax=Bonamia ostreae TaxID=126728 RepID=A0ABV2AJ66_9EUKA